MINKYKYIKKKIKSMEYCRYKQPHTLLPDKQYLLNISNIQFLIFMFSKHYIKNMYM